MECGRKRGGEGDSPRNNRRDQERLKFAMAQNRLLSIDDEPAVCELIKNVAEDVGYSVETTSDPDEFRATVRSFDPTVVVLDLQMPRADGVELLRYLAEVKCRAQVLVVSGVDKKVLETVKRLGTAHGLDMLGALRKPVPVSELETLLRETLGFGEEINEESLAKAIEDGEIIAHYQPKVHLTESGAWKIEAVEALARWHHPRRGLVMPDAFIPLAEENGLIAALTKGVFVTVVKQIREWSDAGVDLSAAVNLSARLLDDLRFPDQLSALVREHGIEERRLIVEITESGVMSDAARAMDVLSRLRIKGFRLSIDDFGTGYSSLVQLYRMPFNEVKIDKSFIMEVINNKEAEAIVLSILGLAKNLGLTACAEGVECQETLDFLRAHSCNAVQGYFISRPIAPQAVIPFVAKWNNEKG
jgi:EAL domain-containing protein (putative c-di-GMP-specific phosphodiesterase class I)/ActR/RegA family two-component response regulator